MAKVKQLLCGTVLCATPNNVKTVDGLPHQMTAIVPAFVLDKEDPKAFVAAINAMLEFNTQVAAGEKVEILDAEGKPATKKDGTPAVLTPSDEIPNRANKVVSQKKGKDVTVVSHGQVFPKSLPTTYKQLAQCLNDGIRNYVGKNSRANLVENFKTDAGKRGRKSATLKLDDI